MSDRIIKGYVIVGAGSPQDLVNNVGQMIEEGWEPIGGVGVCEVTRDIDYCKNSDDSNWDFQFVQAMVEYKSAIATRVN